MNDKLNQALKLIEEAYALRTDKNDPYHGGVLYNKEKAQWDKVISNLKNLAR